MCGFCLTTMAFLLPETARKIVGNGSLPVSKLYKLPFSNVIGYRTCSTKIVPRTSRECHVPNPWLCISILFYKDVAIIVGTVGILYMTCVCVQASLSSIYINLYGFGELQSGLIYLPYGLGCALAAFLTGEKLKKVSFGSQVIVLILIQGKVLDRDYRHTAKASGIAIDTVRGDDISRFPIEKARLRSIFYPITAGLIALLGYGWSLEKKVVCQYPRQQSIFNIL